MSLHSNDEALRRRFAALRRAVAAQTPDAEKFIERGRERTTTRGFRAGKRMFVPRLVPAFLAVLVLVAAWTAWHAKPWQPRYHDASEEGPELSADLYVDPMWDAPTDFLLDVYGTDLIRTMPAFDVPDLPAPPGAPTDSESGLRDVSTRRFEA